MELSRNIFREMENHEASQKASLQKTLLDEKKSAKNKYVDLFVGKRGFWQIVKYEIILLLFSWIPGALGFFCRKLFYPQLFLKVGKGVAFGRNLTLRHPHKISIGNQSYIDDNVVLDAKGENNRGIMVGDNAIVGRNTILSCKEGSIVLGDYANISSNCSLLSETKIIIGRHSFLAGHCYLVAGGNHSFERRDIPIMFQPSQDRGGIDIGEDCWLGASVTVLDGISLGKGCVIGAGTVLTKSFPEYSIVVGNPGRKVKDRGR